MSIRQKAMALTSQNVSRKRRCELLGIWCLVTGALSGGSAAIAGVDLVPIVRSFSIANQSFAADSGSVVDGCVTTGNHRVMRFDFLSHNIGNTDLSVGSPDDHPGLFVYSAGHGHWHLKDFNEFKLYDSMGNQAATGYKQAFCLIDVEHVSSFGPSSKQFTNCDSDQGVSSGWGDLYHASLDCQFIVMDGVPDGDYTLLSTTNTQHAFPEDTFENNTICTGLRIAGNSVTEIDPPVYIAPLLPTVNFNDVPEGETGARAAVLEVRSCRAVNIRFENGPTVVSGPPGTTFGRLGDEVVGLPFTDSVEPRYLRLWMTYVGTNAGDMATGTVKISCDKTAESFDFPITANTINRPSSVTVLVLDQSNSMSFPSGLGDGITRGEVLEFSASPFIDVIQDDNAIGIVGFDHDAETLLPVVPVLPSGRFVANGVLSGYASNPDGWTSIGEGVARAHSLLELETSYDIKAMVVLTDGRENHDVYDRRYIADVADLINERVYAIGLGTAENIRPAALSALCNGTDGDLYMVGQLDADAYFRVAKYYQQILADVENNDIILDPDGWLAPSQTRRIDFRLTETDITFDVILMTPAPGIFRFQVETPAGDLISPGDALSNPVISYVLGSAASHYRFTLPVPIGGTAAKEGTWYAVLSIDKRLFWKYLSGLDKHPKELARARAHGIRYNLSIRTYSNLRMRARLSQDSNEPGATLKLRTVLTEYGLPVDSRAKVSAELERPDATTTTLTLSEIEPGVFVANTTASMSGIYRFRVLAYGSTMRNRTFTREQILTGAVWRGGDDPLPTSTHDPNGRDDRLCRLLQCLARTKTAERLLREYGLDIEEIRRCLGLYCEPTESRTLPPRRQSREELGRFLTDPVMLRILATLGGDSHGPTPPQKDPPQRECAQEHKR